MITSHQFKSALIAALIFAASAYPGQAEPVPQSPAGNAVPVTADNFNRAETDMYFGKRVKRGGVGNLSHSRELYLTDSPVVRPNRDTLYSGAVFDYDAGPVTITLPDAGNRFMSMQVIDEDQYTHAVYYGAGRYTMTREEMGTRYGSLVIRILANPKDPEDMKQVHALQDAIRVEQKSSGKYEAPNFDPVSQTKVRDALLSLGTTILDNKRMFGGRTEVDPVRHLIGSAMLWGGLPEKDALYLNITPDNNDGAALYKLNVQDVPVDGFWSITVYNAKGYLEPIELKNTGHWVPEERPRETTEAFGCAGNCRMHSLESEHAVSACPTPNKEQSETKTPVIRASNTGPESYPCSTQQ
jgi:hypothetical protein